jgi:hypothetical protein
MLLGQPVASTRRDGTWVLTGQYLLVKRPDWLDPPIGDMLPTRWNVVAPLVPSAAAGMIGDMSLAGR